MDLIHRGARCAYAVAAFALLSACVGALEDGPSGPAGSRPSPPSGSGERYTTSPGLRQLAPSEYVSAVESVLEVPVSSASLPLPQPVRGHGRIAGAQRVSYRDVESYYALGIRIAEQVGPAMMERRGCASSDAGCVEAWTAALLRRAFRREPSPELLARYVEMQRDERAGASDLARLTTMLGAVLSSPLFLHRDESGDPTSRALDGFEIATRLSFLVWESEPDAALFADAQAGRLADPDVRAAHLTRMLADRRGERGLVAFVTDWMGLFEDHIARKDAAVLEGTPADLSARAAESFRRTVVHVLAREGATYTDLLRADTFVVDAATAALLGVSEPEGGAFEPRSIAGTGRIGILTHPLVVSAHTKEGGASPFPIGKFVFENVLCDVIPPPPVVLPEPPGDTSSLTFRQQMEALTADEPCASCHVRIGPPGFAFLPFDPLGRRAEADALGRPFDTAGEIPLGDGRLAFADVVEMSEGFAAHEVVASCVARRLFRFAFGRFEHPDDEALVRGLERVATTEGTAPRVLLEAIVRSEAFTRVRTR